MLAHTFNPSTLESHAINPSTKEVETERCMAGKREEYKAGEEKTQCLRRHSAAQSEAVRGGSLRWQSEDRIALSV